jgi:hypothetical protein
VILFSKVKVKAYLDVSTTFLGHPSPILAFALGLDAYLVGECLLGGPGVGGGGCVASVASGGRVVAQHQALAELTRPALLN